MVWECPWISGEECSALPSTPAQGSQANQEDWLANPRNFFALCSLVYGCLQGVIPAVLLFYVRHLLEVIPVLPQSCMQESVREAGQTMQENPLWICKVQNSGKREGNPWKRGMSATAAAELREAAHGFVVRETGVNGNGHLP